MNLSVRGKEGPGRFVLTPLPLYFLSLFNYRGSLSFKTESSPGESTLI